MSGGVVSQRRLSRRGEWRAGIKAFALVAGMTMAGAFLVGVGLVTAHRVVNALPYFVVWMIAGVSAAAVAATRAVGRARSYAVGADIDDDAFAGTPLPLVRRTPGGYVMRLGPGNTGEPGGGRPEARGRWKAVARRFRSRVSSGRAPSTFRCRPRGAPRCTLAWRRSWCA